MICIPIADPGLLSKALEQADVIEFRLDLCPDIQQLATLRTRCPCPVIFTLRKPQETHLFSLAEQGPTYIDLEHDTSPELLKEFKRRFPKIELILSYHNESHTPHDLHALYASMQSPYASLYKIACKALSTNDGLRMLQFCSAHPSLLGMCMGECGSITRLLAASFWSYGCLSLETRTAEGQIPAEEMRSLYHYGQLSALYGLIGDPITHSIGHIVHNQALHLLGHEAIYVKMHVRREELEEFFQRARERNIQGLSVTMPLKEKVLPFLDGIDPTAQAIGAVNTIVNEKGRLIGYNTDAPAALDAIEAHTKVTNKQVLLLGAGGAAKAILYEARRRGAHVHALSRGRLHEIAKRRYDILINATPDPLPIHPSAILPHTIVMDINTQSPKNLLLQEAEKRGCTLIHGYEMFLRQATLQLQLWMEI